MANSSDLLLAKYREWLEIVNFETAVIKSQNWPKLLQYSDRKEEIMKEIKAIEASDSDWKKQQPEALKAIIHQLSGLEQMNQDLLSEKMKSMKAQVEDINKREQTLRQLRMRYSGGTPRTGRKISGEG